MSMSQKINILERYSFDNEMAKECKNNEDPEKTIEWVCKEKYTTDSKKV